jgi:hypothetical protein
MSDQSDRTNQTSPSGPTPSPEPAEERLPSLRETIEQAYDEPEEAAAAGQDGRTRDSYGRFVAKDRAEPGEAEPPKAPSPEKPIREAQPRPPEPAPEGSSTQVPQHWSAEFKADFAKLPPEGQAILLKRHNEMEADYTRKSQAASGAVQFTQSLNPVFSDPIIAGSLQRDGVNATEAIQQWAGFHKRAMDPDVRERINLLVDLSQRMGLDPTRLFAVPNQPQTPLSPEDMADPAIRYFADQQSRTVSDLQALRGELQAMRQAEAQQREAETVQATRWSIDQWADEKDQQGRPLRPYFDAVVEDIVDMFKANPQRDLAEAYEKAVWANPGVRAHMLAQERQQQQNQTSVDRARQAVRGNTRGLTSPVAKPNAKTGNGSLRDTLESAADEVGFT